MSWTAWQTKWRAPTLMGGIPLAPFYLDGNGYMRYLWYTGSSSMPTISHKTKIGYSIVVNGDECKPNYIYYNGFSGYVGSSYSVWYDPAYGWVAAPKSSLAVGAPLVETWQYVDPTDSSRGGHYYGSYFYTLKTGSDVGQAVGFGQTATAYGRGNLRGTTYNAISSYTLTLETAWEYWQTDADTTLYGKYSPLGTAEDDRYFGSPQWKRDDVEYCRKPNPAANGKFDYGSVAWNDDASKYVLGVYNSSAGWNESDSAPTPGSSWTLTFAKPEDSEATGSNITLEWDKWTLGSYTKNINVMRASSKWTSL